VPARISIRPSPIRSQNRLEPQREQNPRRAAGEDWYQASVSSASKVSAERSQAVAAK